MRRLHEQRRHEVCRDFPLEGSVELDGPIMSRRAKSFAAGVLGPWLTTAAAGVAWYVNLSFADVADVPPAVVTVTLTVPVPVGLVTSIEVALSLPGMIVAARVAEIHRGIEPGSRR